MKVEWKLVCRQMNRRTMAYINYVYLQRMAKENPVGGLEKMNTENTGVTKSALSYVNINI